MRGSPELITIPARRGKAARVKAGQVITVINTHGQQVVDTWAFAAGDLGEFMSMEHSRAAMRKITPVPQDCDMPMCAEDASAWPLCEPQSSMNFSNL